MSDTKNRQFRDLLQRDQSSRDFFREFVELFSQMANVDLGLAWSGQSEPFEPICQVLRDPDTTVKLPMSNHRHDALLKETLTNEQATLAAPPTNELPSILVGVLKRESDTALVEFVLPVQNSNEQNQEILKSLADCCRMAKAAVAMDSTDSGVSTLNAPSETQPTGTQPTGTALTTTHAGQLAPTLNGQVLDTFTSTIHRSLDFRDTATNIANEARRMLDCDRVTVFKQVGGKFRTESISGQATVNRRSNTVKALSKLANATLTTGRPFWFPTQELGSLPAQIENPLNDYMQQSLTRSVAIMPIFDRELDDQIDPTVRKVKPKVIGGLVVEHANSQWEQAAIEPHVQVLTRHAGNALRNAYDVDSIMFYPLWRSIGRTAAVTKARHLGKVLWGIVAAVALLLAMIFVPANFDLTCEGELVPTQRQNVFAEQQGKVVSVEVGHGDTVNRGDVLLRLENEDLEIQIEQVQGELDALRQRLVGSRSIRITSSRNSRQDSSNKEVNQRELQTQIASLQRRLKTLNAKRDQLKVVSPISGQILTWDIQNLLKNRPVQQGSLLVEVADTKGEWELSLNLPDRKVGHLFEAVQSNEQPLEVRFTMASDPTKEFVGHVRDVATSTSLNQDNLQVLQIQVEVESDKIGDLKHTGSTVSAKIHCGQRRLGFVWLHDAWEFVQYRVWFQLFG